MKARVTIEYAIDQWDLVSLGLAKLREREELRWMTDETVLALRSGTVRVELSPDEP